MTAIFVALDELLTYVPVANQDSTPTARARNHAEAIDKAVRFRLALLRKLTEVKRVHGDQVVLDALRAQHFQHAAEHLGSAIFGDLMKNYYERRVFDATVARNAKAIPLLLGWRRRSLDTGVNVDVDVAAVMSVAAKVSTSDGVGSLSSELLALCEVTVR
eukprot:jgi/Tetstr1/436722/TSEL_025505.t1